MRRYLIPFLLLFVSISEISQAFEQGKQKILKDFFMGKWGGTISGAVVYVDEHNHKQIRPFTIELIGHPTKLGIGPFGGGGTAWMRFDATWPNKFTLVDTFVGCQFTFGPDCPIFGILYPVISNPASEAELGYSTIFWLAGFTAQVENKNLILLTSGGTEEEFWEDSWAKGELYRIYTKKDTLGKTVHVDELIKTDKFTQREIVVPNKGEVIVNTNSECKFKEDKLLEQYAGEIFAKIKKLPPEAFKVRTPQAVSSVRGTRFITRVEKDGTTILTVLDGEVEFSDINKKKTVIVKKNQRSVVKPGGLPSEPETINHNQIPRWWE